MKVRYQVLILCLVIVGAFLAGSWVTFQGTRAGAPERKILHYVDPMNPSLKSDKPGIAPCGMPLEPVYADSGGPAGGADQKASLPPGTIRISPEKQQLIGVRVMTVEKAPWSHTLRVLGRVTPDETRVYRINTATEGWIEKTPPVTTGSLVRENDLLATLSFFSLEYRTLIQNYFNLVNRGGVDFAGIPNQPTPEQARQIAELKSQYSAPQLKQLRETSQRTGDVGGTSQLDYYRRYLFNYGIGSYQLKEMERTRTFPDAVEIRSPASGFVLSRNISPGLRVEKGVELFRIADLSRVWVLADIFENEASFFRPGVQVRMELPYQRKSLHAQVSPVLPQFDPATRTFKVRLVADNPGYAMRPDMFVNVELPVSGPPAMLVPADAVLDTGLKKTVFVDHGNGFFEPRPVETGLMLGERVEIARGLAAGEKIVVSGNFLIDSEARMQQAASGIIGKVGRDPVCLMNIDEDRAKAGGKTAQYKGNSYFFCSPECREEFVKNPERYLKSTPMAAASAMEMPQGVAADGHPQRKTSETGGPMKRPAAHDKMAMSPGPQPPSGAAPKLVLDPVCSMGIDEDRSRRDGQVVRYKGKSYLFCSTECREEFARHPEQYLKTAPPQEKMAMPPAGSPMAPADHSAHGQPGGKKSPASHEGMVMPGAPAAMPGMGQPPAGPASGPAGMPMPAGASPMTGPQPARTGLPPGAIPDPFSGNASLPVSIPPRSQQPGSEPPSGMAPGSPPFPGQKEASPMPMPGQPAPPKMDVPALPGAKMGEAAAPSFPGATGTGAKAPPFPGQSGPGGAAPPAASNPEAGAGSDPRMAAPSQPASSPVNLKAHSREALKRALADPRRKKPAPGTTSPETGPPASGAPGMGPAMPPLPGQPGMPAPLPNGAPR